MPNVTRIGDISVGICACCCDACPHGWASVHVVGSPDVFANARNVMRAPGDIGMSSCPHCPTSFSMTGSGTVFANGKSVHRLGDVHVVGCGTGVVVSASPNVTAGG